MSVERRVAVDAPTADVAPGGVRRRLARPIPEVASALHPGRRDPTDRPSPPVPTSAQLRVTSPGAHFAGACCLQAGPACRVSIWGPSCLSMDPAIAAALTTAALGGLGWLVAHVVKSKQEHQRLLVDRRHEAHTEFQRQCDKTFDQGLRLVRDITPPRPRDVARLVRELDDDSSDLDQCKQAQFRVATLAGPQVRRTVDSMGSMFNARASLVQAAVYRLGEPLNDEQRHDIEAASDRLVHSWGQSQRAWGIVLTDFATAARRELGVA